MSWWHVWTAASPCWTRTCMGHACRGCPLSRLYWAARLTATLLWREGKTVGWVVLTCLDQRGERGCVLSRCESRCISPGATRRLARGERPGEGSREARSRAGSLVSIAGEAEAQRLPFAGACVAPCAAARPRRNARRLQGVGTGWIVPVPGECRRGPCQQPGVDAGRGAAETSCRSPGRLARRVLRVAKDSAPQMWSAWL